MTHARISTTLAFLLSFGIVTTSAQKPVPHKTVSNPAPQHQISKANPFSMPSRMIECESPTTICLTPSATYVFPWVFTGTKGKLILPGNDADIDLTIERFEPDSIVVTRNDRTGPLAGFIAKYTGTYKDGRITGLVDYDWPGHPFAKKGRWGALIEDTRGVIPEAYTDGKRPSAIPPYIIDCDPNSPCNGYWTFNGSKVGTGIWEDTKPMVKATLIIENFEPDNIVIRRAFPGNPAASATYKGVLKGNEIHGNVTFFNAGKEATGPWSAGVPAVSCKRSDGIEPSLQQVKEIAANAEHFNQVKLAFDCWMIAARTGDALAEVAIADLYYKGSPQIPQNYSEAAAWIKKAAAQENPHGARALAALYARGHGIPQDSIMADYWVLKAASEDALAAQGATPDVFGLSDLYLIGPPPVKVANGHHIMIPDGASEKFASYPPNIRAVLRPARHVPQKLDPPCDTTEHVGNEDALEIGKAAYRAADFTRGQCWMLRSSKGGHGGHADVLLGVSALMGWGDPKGPEAAFKYFKSQQGTGNMWAEYFLQFCYRNGIGTAVDADAANKIENTYLRQSDVIASIGADDVEEVRERARLNAEISPERVTDRVCNKVIASFWGSRAVDCHDRAGAIDEDAQADRLNDANNIIPMSKDLVDPESPR